MKPNGLFPAVTHNIGRNENMYSFAVACRMEQVMGSMDDEFSSPIHNCEGCILIDLTEVRK